MRTVHAFNEEWLRLDQLDRQQILDAIRALAESNDGQPPGIKRFRRQTRIRDSEWQRIWVRWGDALREAGYKPNTLKPRYSDEFLLSNLAAFTRELGHFPLQAEIRVKAANSPGFPGTSRYSKLGRKAIRANALADWCRANSGWDDVLAFSEKAAEEAAAHDSRIADAAAKPGHGYVYLMKSGKYHKIGYSNSPARRRLQLEPMLPEPLEAVHEISTDDPIGVERYWHTRFADRRTNGEWFRLTPQDVAVFCRRSFM